MNQAINYVKATLKQISAAEYLPSLLHNYMSVFLNLLTYTRQALDQSDGCSYLETYEWQSMPESLKIHLQWIEPEAHRTVLNVMMKAI